MTPEENNRSPRSLSPGGRLGFLLKDSFFYGSAAAVSRASGLISFPILARHFSVKDYGVIDFFVTISGLAVTVLIFGQDSSVARFFYERDDLAHRRQVVSQSLFIQLGTIAVILPIAWMIAGYVSHLFDSTNEIGLLLRIILLQLPFAVLVSFSQNILKWSFARKRFLFVSLGFTFAQTLFLVLAAIIFDAGIRDILISSLLTTFIFGLFGLFFVRRWLIWPRRWDLVRALLIFGCPYGVIGVISAASPTVERSLIVNLLPPDNLGWYAAGVKVASLMGLATAAFQTAWGPFSMSLYKEPSAIVTYNWVLKGFSIFSTTSAFALAIVSVPLLSTLASDRFLEASIVVLPLSLGLAIMATSWISEVGIAFSRRTHLALYGFIASLTVTLLGIIILAPRYGLLGVAASVLAGQIVRGLISSWLAQRAFPMPWDYRPVLGLFVVALCGGAVAIQAGRAAGYSAFAGTCGLAIAMLFAYFSIFVLHKHDRSRIVAFCLQLVRR